MINNQQRVIVNVGEAHGHQPVSAKPSVVSVSSIDSDVSDRRDVREALYSGIFRRHRKTILVFGSFLKMLREYLDRMHDLAQLVCKVSKVKPGKVLALNLVSVKSISQCAQQLLQKKQSIGAIKWIFQF